MPRTRNTAYIVDGIIHGCRPDNVVSSTHHGWRISFISVQEGYSKVEGAEWDNIIIPRNLVYKLDKHWWGAIHTHGKRIELIGEWL